MLPERVIEAESSAPVRPDRRALHGIVRTLRSRPAVEETANRRIDDVGVGREIVADQSVYLMVAVARKIDVVSLP
jgi:hypothetical protein